MNERGHSLDTLMNIIREFVKARDWEKYQLPKALALSTAIEVGELLELFQWRDDEEIDALLQDSDYLQTLSDEIADVLVYILRLADVTGIDPTKAVQDKMKRNAERYPVDEWSGKIPEKFK